MRRYAAFYILIPWLGFSNPILHEIIQGDVRTSSKDQIFTVVASDEAMIDWMDFSILEGETTCFIQPNAESVVLNRVTGPDSSNILGKLEANGKVLLINSNGILFGKDCKINTASLIASSLDLKSFRLNRDYEFKTQNHSSIVNLGTIHTSKGDLFLLGATIENHGLLEAKNGAVGLASASNIQLKENELQHIFSQNENDSGHFKIVVSGTLLSKKEMGNGGEIVLFGKTIEVGDCVLDTSDLYGGGSIKIGGSLRGKNRTLPVAYKTLVSPNAVISADCTLEGNGGEVIIWGDEVAGHWGTTSAKGGSLRGDGGSVEISCPKHLVALGKVDTTAVHGKVGTLLLDPTDVIISSAADIGIATFPPPDYTFVGPTATINNTSLQTFLMTNSVIVNATTGGGITGSIIVLDPIVWGPPVGTRLTLLSPGPILIRANILENSPSPFPGGSVVLISDSGNQIQINGGPFPIGIGKSVSVGSQDGITMVGDPDLPRCMRSRPILQIESFGLMATPSTSRLGFQVPSGGVATGSIDVTCFDLGISADLFSFSAIGHGDSIFDPPSASLLTTTPSATITVDASGSVGIRADDLNSMSAIGHGSYNLDPNSDLQGDICVTSVFDNVLNIRNALSGAGGKAAIGHGAAPGAGFVNAAGNISVLSRMNIRLHASEQVNAYAIIGHCPVAGTATGDIFVSALFDVTLSSNNITATANVNAVIGHQNSTPNTLIPVVASNISVSAGENICIRAGISENACGIGHFATDLTGIVAVSANGNLTMINQNDNKALFVFLGSASINPSPLAHTFVAVGGNIWIGENLSGSYCCPFSSCFNMQTPNSGVISIRAPGDVNVATQSDILAIGSNGGPPLSFISTLNDVNGTTRICARGSVTAFNGPPVNGTPFLLGINNLLPTSSSIDFRVGNSIQMLNNFNTMGAGSALISATTTFLPGQLWTANTNQLTSVCGQAVPVLTLTTCGSCPSNVQPLNFPPSSPLLPPPVPCGSLSTTSILIQTVNGPITLLNPGLPVPPDTPVGFCSTCTPCQTLTLGPFPNNIQLSTLAGTVFVSTFNDIIVNQALTTSGSIFIEACRDLTANSTITCSGTGNIELAAGRDLNLAGVTVATDSGTICLSAFQDALLNQRILSNTGTITAQAGRNITIPTAVLVRTSNAILMVAGENLSMAGTARINSIGSSVTIVVDNAFPAPPLIGPGSLQTGPLTRIDALTAIRIFSAMQGLNDIQSQFTVNSVLIPFAPATDLFSDTQQEVWCTYAPQPLMLCAPYSNPFSGCGVFPAPLVSSPSIPLTVFYKICLQQVTVQAMKIVQEFLVDLHPYNEFPGWMEECWIEYRNLPRLKKIGKLSSLAVLSDEPYYFRRRQLNAINHPKSWTQLMPYNIPIVIQESAFWRD